MNPEPAESTDKSTSTPPPPSEGGQTRAAEEKNEAEDSETLPIVEIAASISAAASPSVDDKPNTADAPEKENVLLNLVINVIIPTVVLMKLSSEDRLGPFWALLVGLAFPVLYGVWDLIKRRRWNFFSIVGIASVLLTGGLELFEVKPIWFAVKEAAIPLVIGVIVLLSMRSKRPLVKTLLLNPQVLDLRKVYRALKENGKTEEFEKHLDHSSYWLAASFLVSAILNFFLTIYVIKSEGGTPARAAEIGKLQMLSYPVIVVPTTAILFFALFRLLKGIKKLTSLDLHDIFHIDEEDEKKNAQKEAAGSPG